MLVKLRVRGGGEGHGDGGEVIVPLYGTLKIS
jgi:hypothetical protein